MLSLRSSALQAISILYCGARDRVDLEAINVYTDAALHIAPWLTSITSTITSTEAELAQMEARTRRPSRPTVEPKTIIGVGSSTIFVKP